MAKYQLPRSTQFPVTITDLHVAKNAEVKQFQPLLTYIYKTTVTEDTDEGGEVKRVIEVPSKWESPSEGKILRWHVSKGMVINGPQ